MPINNLEQLDTIFQVAGEDLAQIHDWLEVPSNELMKKPGFKSLLTHVPGLEASFTGMLKLAEETDQNASFWRVIHHTLRTIVYYSTQNHPVSYEHALYDARGVYAMVLANDVEGFEKALHEYLKSLANVTSAQRGLIPYLLLWHDGFGLKGIGNRANHQKRIVGFLKAMEITKLITLDSTSQFFNPFDEFIFISILFPLLEDIGYMPHNGKLRYYTWKFYSYAKTNHPSLLNDRGISFFLDLQLVFSVYDVGSIREPGRLQNPQQVLDWVDLKNTIRTRLLQLQQSEKLISTNVIVQSDLADLIVSHETQGILQNFLDNNPESLSMLQATLEQLNPSRYSLLDKYLPRIIDYSYFGHLLASLTKSGRFTEFVNFFTLLCEFVSNLDLNSWVKLNLDRDYLNINDTNPENPILQFLSNSNNVEVFLSSANITYYQSEIELQYSFQRVLNK